MRRILIYFISVWYSDWLLVDKSKKVDKFVETERTTKQHKRQSAIIAHLLSCSFIFHHHLTEELLCTLLCYTLKCLLVHTMFNVQKDEEIESKLITARQLQKAFSLLWQFPLSDAVTTHQSVVCDNISPPSRFFFSSGTCMLEFPSLAWPIFGCFYVQLKRAQNNVTRQKRH